MIDRPTRPSWQALAAVAVVSAIGLAGCTAANAPTGESAPTEDSTMETSSPSPTYSEHAGKPAEPAKPEASNAPTNAPTKAFCGSFNPADTQPGQSAAAIAPTQKKMLKVGTPGDLPAPARAGWEWFVSIDSDDDWRNMSNDDMAALFVYYNQHC